MVTNELENFVFYIDRCMKIIVKLTKKKKKNFKQQSVQQIMLVVAFPKTSEPNRVAYGKEMLKIQFNDDNNDDDDDDKDENKNKNENANEDEKQNGVSLFIMNSININATFLNVIITTN